MLAAQAAALFVALEHFAFMAMETFLWTTPKVRKIFGQSAESAEGTRVLAANQGVYNGALALCLVAAVLTGEVFATRLLLGFVIAVGLYGGYSVKKSIVFVQALPAAIALALSYVA